MPEPCSIISIRYARVFLFVIQKSPYIEQAGKSSVNLLYYIMFNGTNTYFSVISLIVLSEYFFLDLYRLTIQKSNILYLLRILFDYSFLLYTFSYTFLNWKLLTFLIIFFEFFHIGLSILITGQLEIVDSTIFHLRLCKCISIWVSLFTY